MQKKTKLDDDDFSPFHLLYCCRFIILQVTLCNYGVSIMF